MLPSSQRAEGDGGWHLFIRQVDGQTGGWSDRWMVRQVDGQTGGQSDRWMVRQVDGQTGGRSDRWMGCGYTVAAWHGCMNGAVHGCKMHGCMGAWVHGCMDAWMHGCMDAWDERVMMITHTPATDSVGPSTTLRGC